MAEKVYIKEKQGKFGDYSTSTGGGEPIAKGKKWTDEKRDPDQPRTDDGKFTYNSANGKPLKDVSKVHGKSRGTTIPPQLVNGQNGIRYYKGKEDKNGHVTRDFEGGRVYDADERAAKATGMAIDEIYKEGDEIVTFDGKIKVAPRDMIESAMEYIANKGMEGKMSESIKEAVQARLTLKGKELFHKDETGKEVAGGDKNGKGYLKDKEYSEEEKAKAKEVLSGFADKALKQGHYKEDITSEWGASKEATTDKEKAAVEKAEAEGTKGKEMVEREPEPKKEYEPDVKKAPASTPVAPSMDRSERAPVSASASSEFAKIESGADKYSPEQIEAVKSMLGEGYEDLTSDKLESMVSSGELSQEDIDLASEALGEEEPEETKTEEKSEEKTEAEVPAETAEEAVETAEEEAGKEISKEEFLEMMKDPENAAMKASILEDARKALGKEAEGLTDMAILEMLWDKEKGE